MEYKKQVSDATLGLKSKPTPLLFYPIYLHFYLDSRFKKRVHHVHIINGEDHYNGHTYKLFKEINVSGFINGLSLPRDSKLCILAQVSALSETGALCRINFGRTVINLFNNHGSTSYQLKMHSIDQNPTKSVIKLGKITIENATFSEEQGQTLNVAENIPKINKYMQEYVKTSVICDSCLGSFMPGSEDIRCPTNPSQITFDNSDIPLPLASFILADPLVTTESFWNQQLLIYATRYLISKPLWYSINYAKIDDHQFIISEFTREFKSSSIKVKASMAINIICQYPQMLEYISDYTVNEMGEKDGIEDFGDVIFTSSGDCEDLCFGIFILLNSFLELFSRITHPIFTEMRRILSGYISIIIIEGVTSNNIQNVPKNLRNGDNVPNGKKPPTLTGAHAALKLIPLNQFHLYLKNWSHDHFLTLHVKKESDTFYKSNPDIKEEDMIILIGEGTGMLEGGIILDEMSKEREFVNKCFVIDKVKKPIIPKVRSISPFYQALLFGITDRYIDSHGIGTFYFSTKQPEKYYSVSNKYLDEYKIKDRFSKQLVGYGKGCTFGDFIENAQSITVVPNRCKNDEPYSREFDKFIVDVMKNVTSTRVPTPELLYEKQFKCSILNIESQEAACLDVFDSEENDNVPIFNHSFSKPEFTSLLELTKFFHNCEKMKLFRKDKKPYGVIPIYLLEDYVDDTFIKEIKDYFINKKGSTVGDINIYKEYHTNKFYVYRMDFVFYK
jgi:hypothetical protein